MESRLLRHPLSLERRDEGFTLIELLVVIIIIGILAAIAVPIFLGQRSRATDAAIKSDMRSVAAFQENWYASNQNYGTIGDLQGEGFTTPSQGVTIEVDSYDPSGFCVVGTHPQSSRTWYYDSQAGGFQAEGSPGCPVSTGGAYGNSVTG